VPNALQIRPRKSVGENLERIIPALIEEFRSCLPPTPRTTEQVIQLHDSRLAGKPLRYLMEIAAPLYGAEFGESLKEVKKILDLLGRIHDCDVAVKILSDSITSLPGGKSHSRAKGQDAEEGERRREQAIESMNAVIRVQEIEKERLTDLLFATLQRWDDEQFVSSVGAIMNRSAVAA